MQVYNTERSGVSRISPGSFTRVASIGQIFADMMQAPDLCGGMSHVLSVWDEHAAAYLQLILDTVDSYCSDLGKRRAGYILEERLKMSHPLVDKWKSIVFLDAGGKLDPSKEYGIQTSEKWNLAINV